MIRVYWVIEYQDSDGHDVRIVPHCHDHVLPCMRCIARSGGTVMRVQKITSGTPRPEQVAS